ncbi:glycosyltransferase family 4 protein [Euzebya tangerina]|uniref:glycosyltransferase family 4 protein n=1 Tax=Euzebya tangerina TaxID=591198 RepID=UPI0013C361D7|nr:glycosyltransferase family 4 protein [Euzebya tangerina]
MTTNRVLHVVESWPPVPSGYARRSHALVAAQSRQAAIDPAVLVTSRQWVYTDDVTSTPDHDLVVCRSSPSEDRWRRIRPFHVDVARLRDEVVSAARAHDATIVHVHWSSGIGRAAAMAATRLGLPLVAEVRFDLAGAVVAQGAVTPEVIESALRRRFESHLDDAAVVIAASHPTAELVRRTTGLAVEVVENAVEPGGFEAPDGAGAAERQDLGIRPERVVVGSTAKQLRYEGLDLLLSAAAACESPPVVLLIGTGPEASRLRREAATTGIDVRLTGAVPAARIPGLLAAMDLFVAPRRDTSITRWASPLKVLEAMDAGVAVVGSAVGDIPRLLAGGRGFIVAAGAVHELTAVLDEAMTRPDLRQGRATAAQAWIRQQGDWDAAAARYAEIYRTVPRVQR